MSLSDCEKCWDTPCTCGNQYRNYSAERRTELAAAALGMPVADLRAALAAKTEEQQSTDLMAQCMDMVRSELIEAGIIDKTVPPMMVANAVCAHIASLAVPAATVAVNEFKTGAGLTVKREAKTTGENGWLLYSHDGRLIRALNGGESAFVDAALAAVTWPAVQQGGEAGK